MRKIVLFFAATVSAVVLLFSYRTSTNPDGFATRHGQVPVGSAVPSPSASAGAPTTRSGAGTSGKYDGGAADTRYGPVQVRITLSRGRITDVQALQVPNESGRDVEINSAAIPVLVQETLQAQSAQVDTVSGATYTSEGYMESLQSAIDAAHR